MRKMKTVKLNRIMIAGTHSGCGKTTITCGLLKALLNKGMAVQGFKSGPDYIDPLFHTEIIGTQSRNLDMFLCGEETTKYLLAKNGKHSDISVIEGVMGFYDGLDGHTCAYSSWDLAEKTKTPVLLVVNGQGMFQSILALIKGFMAFHPNQIQGLLLNNISSGMYPTFKAMIEKECQINVYGYLPTQSEFVLESRHLGLVTAQEIQSLDKKIEDLAVSIKENIDVDGIIALAEKSEPLLYPEYSVEPIKKVNIGIARDKAFCFYYEDSLDLLRELGATLIPFSPLTSEQLPDNIHGIILGGGYPELYLEPLSKNKGLRQAIRKKIGQGMPVYAECGGFMYLGNKISNKTKCFDMVGAIDQETTLTDTLQNFGYVELRAKATNVFSEDNARIHGHEFHYSSSTNCGNSFQCTKKTGKTWESIWGSESMYAGYPHIHLWGNIAFAKSFIEACHIEKERKR